MALSKLEQSIEVLKFLLDEQRVKVDQLERRSELTEKQKIYIEDHKKLYRAVETLIDRVKKQMWSALAKMPPQVIDLEKSVLGKIMLHSIATQNIQSDITMVKSFLLPDHFYLESHIEIYKACLQIANQNRIVDMRSVVWQLRQNKTIELIGGSHYIAELTSGVSSSKNIEWEARLIVEQAIKRQIITISGDAMMDAYEDDTDCFVMLDRVEREYTLLREWIKP